MAVLRYSLVVALVSVQEGAEVVITVPGIGAKRDGFSEGSLGIGGASGAVVGFGHANHRVGVTGIELEGALVLLQGEVVFSGGEMDAAQRYIDHGQAIVELLRFLAIRQSFVDPLTVFVSLVFQTVGFA